MLSLPKTKGFEIVDFQHPNDGRNKHNDPFVMRDGRVRTTTNSSRNPGHSNGDVFRGIFKPTATITRSQQTVTKSGEATILPRGRHDPCVSTEPVLMVEA
jgi:chorismate synthase